MKKLSQCFGSAFTGLSFCICMHRNAVVVTSQGRHSGPDSVSNHQPHYCLLKRLFGRRSKKTSKLRVTFVRGIHRRPANSPHKWPVTRKMFPFDYVIMFHWHSQICRADFYLLVSHYHHCHDYCGSYGVVVHNNSVSTAKTFLQLKWMRITTYALRWCNESTATVMKAVHKRCDIRRTRHVTWFYIHLSLTMYYGRVQINSLYSFCPYHNYNRQCGIISFFRRRAEGPSCVQKGWHHRNDLTIHEYDNLFGTYYFRRLNMHQARKTWGYYITVRLYRV